MKKFFGVLFGAFTLLLSSLVITGAPMVSGAIVRSAFQGGTGTVADPYLIADCAQLQAIDDVNTDLSKVFKLANDIDCSQVSLTPMKNGSVYFTGTLDGDGHSISGFSMTCATNDCGLFARTYGSTIKNLTFVSPVVTTSAAYVGLLAGRSFNQILFDNITITGGSVTNTFAGSETAHETLTYTGGLSGDYTTNTTPAPNGTISNIDSSMTIVGKSMTGGIVGEVRSGATLTVSDVEVRGDVSGLSWVGGVIGRGQDAASGATNNGVTIVRANVTAASVGGTGQKIGGILGFGWNVTIRESRSSAAVSGRAAGDAVGIRVGIGQGAKVGGIAGEISGGTSRIEDTISTGNVTATGTDGAIVADDVGGILGWARLTTLYLTRVAHVGSVTGTTRVGGLVGNQSSAAFIDDSYSRSDLSGFSTSDHYGGLVGVVSSSSVQVRRSYFAGTQNGVVSTARYSVVKVDGSARVTCTGFFFDSELLGSGKTSSTANRCGGNDGPASKTTADMKLASTFTSASWNFTTGSAIWTVAQGINGGYPHHDSAGLDSTPPTATWTAPSSPSASRTLSYTLTFSEQVTGIAAGDIINIGTASCTNTVSSASGTSVIVTATCSTDGTVVLRLVANSVTDSASNTGPTSALTAPSVTIDTVVTTTTLSPSTTLSPTNTAAPSNTVAPANTVAPVNTVTPTASVPATTTPTDTNTAAGATPSTTAPSTTTSSSTTTTTLPELVVPEVADDGGALVIDGERIEATVTRENNQLILQAGVIRARISAVKREGGRAPLDSEGRIRMATGDSIAVEVTGFGPSSPVEVRMYSDPVLLGRSNVDALGALAASYEVPESVDNGRHTVVLIGESAANEELTFALAVYVGEESSGPSALALLVGIPLGLAVIGALIIPAILRRRRDDPAGV